jgi:outer membrane protein assembly factor BamE
MLPGRVRGLLKKLMSFAHVRYHLRSLHNHLYNRLMRRLVILSSVLTLSAMLAITGCARDRRPSDRPSGAMLSNLPFVYKMTVQQGNIITEAMVNQVQLGMNREQVRYLLGTPLLTDLFHTDRWDYVYTIRRGHQPMEIKRLTLWFEDDQLISIEGFAQPDPEAALVALEEETVVVEVPDWRDNRGIISRTLNAVGVDTAD